MTIEDWSFPQGCSCHPLLSQCLSALCAWAKGLPWPSLVSHHPLSWHSLTLGPGCCCQIFQRSPFHSQHLPRRAVGIATVLLFYSIFLSSSFYSFFLLQKFGNRCWNLFPSEGVNRTSETKTKLKQIGHLLLVALINCYPEMQKQIQNHSEILLIV